MKKVITLMLVTAFALMLFSGCDTNTESGGQEITTKQFEYDGFNKIDVNSAFEVEISQGNTYSINITAGDFSRIKLDKIGDTLQVSRKGTDWFAPSHQTPVAYITLPNLDTISLSGATKVTVSNFHSNEDLTLRVSEASHLETIDVSAASLFLEVSGASRLKGDLKAMGGADLVVSGSSIVELIGMAADVSAKVSGSSRCDLINFPVCNAEINVSGASNGWTNLNGRLDANVSGASNLTWRGNTTLGDIRTSGGSYLCGGK